MLGTGWDADAFLVNRSRIRPLARVGSTLAAWLHVADVRSVASGSLLRREPAKSSALVLMPVASCDGESLLGSVEVRTSKGTEPMSVCDSGSGGQGCKHSVSRAVGAGRRWNVTCRLRLSSHWNYKKKFTKFWTDLFGCHVPGSAESCGASSGK